MDTGVVVIQEPVFTKTSVEEAPATMEVDKANLSTAHDDCRNSIDSVESKHEKEEAMKTVSVEEDSKIVKEKSNETETDEQGTTYVHEPESFNKTTNDANISLSEATLDKEKEDDFTEKLEEVREEKDSRTVESSVNGTETEHKATVSVDEISRNGENIVKEPALEEEPSRDGVSLHDVETTKGVLLETEKVAEPRLDAEEKEETETVNTIVNDPLIVNTEETIVHESTSLKENAEPVEAIKNPQDDAEKISREVTGDKEKEEDIIQKAEEVEESFTVIETPTIQGEDSEPKVSKDTEEHEHVLVRDIPQDETLVPKAETVNTSTVQESAEPSLDLKEEEGTVKTVTSSDEVQDCITVIEPPKASPDQRSKDTEEDEHVLDRNIPQGEIFVTEAESLVTQKDTEPILDLKEDKEQEKTEKSEEIPSDLALKVDKVFGAQTMERGLELNESEAEQTGRNRTDETEESSVEKLVAHPDVESVEQMEKPSLESPSEVSVETSKTLDEKIEEKLEEEVPPHEEGQEEDSYGSETKEETVSVPESSELGGKFQEERSLVLTPLQEESFLTIEKDKEETKLQKEEVHKHEPATEEAKSDEVVEVSSASPSEEQEGETVVEEMKANEDEQVPEKIHRSLETVETVDTEPVKSNEEDIKESLSSVNEEKASRIAETSVNATEDEHNATVSVEGISKNSENIFHETAPEEIKSSDEAEKISHEVTGDIEKKEDITREIEEVQESPTVIETQIIQEEKIEPKASKDSEEHAHALVRDMPQINTLVTEAEDVNISTVQEFEAEVGQETEQDIEPSLDLKEETETAKTFISSDEERPSDHVDAQAEESVEVKSKEILQDETNEEKHENLLDVPCGESEKFQVNEPETVLLDKTEVDEVDGTQVMGEQRGLEPNEPEAEQIDRRKTDEAEETPVVVSVEKMQSSSLECTSEVSEETSTTVDEKIEEKLQEEEVTLQQEEPQSLFPSCSEEQEHEAVSEKIGDEKAKEEEPTLQILSEDDATKSHERQDELHKTVETMAVQEEHTRDIGSSLNEKCSMDQTQAEEQQVNDEHVDSQNSVVFSEKSDNENLTAEAKKGNEETAVSDMQQGETIVTEADREAVDTSTVQEAGVLNTLETTSNESEAVHSPIGGEEESQVTKEVTEPSLDLKEDNEHEETETVKTVILSDEVIKDESQGREEPVEVKPKEIVQHESTQVEDENLLDIPSGESTEKMQRPSLESPSELPEETSKKVDEKIEEEPEEVVTPHQESQETDPVPESSELGVQAKEEESSPPNEQEKERTLQKEKIEKHESTSEEDSSTHQTPAEEKSDEVVEVSSASPLEERKGETLVESEKIEDIIKASEEEQVADNMQRSLETVVKVEPLSSFPSPPEEHETVAEAEKIEDGKVKETEPMGDISDKGLDVSETKDLSLPLEAAGSDGTESSELSAESGEQKPKQVKEILEGEKMEADETKPEELPSSETTPQETLSDVVAVQLKREDNATESIERQEELSKDKEMEETTVAQEEQTRDIGTSLTEPEEQVNEESTRDEQEKVSSTEKGETKTKELEEENIDEYVDSSEKNDQETLVAKTTKEDEDKTVGLDGSGTSNTSENVCIKQEEFETLEAPKLEESKENKSQEISETIEAIESKGDQTPSFISELEDQIPKQIEEIHDEETKEEQSLEKSQDYQTPSLVSEQVEEIHEEEEETKGSDKVEATSGQDLPVETSQAHQTPSSKLVSEMDDKTPKQIEEIHEEEIKSHKAPVSMLASKEDDQVTVQESNGAGDRQEKEESVGETERKESEAERTEKLDDKVTMIGDEDTKKTEVEVAETTKEQSMVTHAPENACLEQEELKDLETLQSGEIIEGKVSLKNDNSDDFTFSTETGEAEHVDETSSTLPVVGILKELQTTLEESERAVNDSEAESCGIDLHSIKAEPENLEKSLVVEEPPASEIIEANMLQQDERGETEKNQEDNGLTDKSLPVEELKLQEEHKEEGKVQDSISREFEVDAEEKLQEETREIAEFKEETPADGSLKEVVPAEKTPLPSEELEHVGSSEKQVEQEPQKDLNASTSEMISLEEEDPRDFETSKKEQNTETHVTVKGEDQIVDIQEEKKNEMRDENLSGLSAPSETEETFSSEVKKDQEDESELGVGHDSDTLQVGKEEEAHSVLGNDHEINEVVTPEKQITDPMGVVKKASEAEHESNEEHIESQAISDDTKSNNDRGFPTEEAPKDQREEVNADNSLTEEALDLKVQDQPKDFEAPVTDRDTTEQEKKSNDLIYVQEDIGTNVKPEVRDSVVAQKEETSSLEEKSEVDYVKTEPEDAIRHGDSTKEKHKASEKIDEGATKDIYQEESKQTDTVAALKDEIKEEEKETTHESFNTKKNTDDVTEKTKPEILEIENSSSISDTQDKSSKEIEEPKQKDEVPNQQKREIADEVPKTEEELQQREGESEPTVKEPARKSLSDLIQKVKVTDKTEVATTEPRIEEEANAEEQDEDGEEHKDDKTSPDSIVMVEAKDTVSIIKTHKKSQGILSGVGSKVKHSISKVKKALTGKSSHTTKPSSPQ